MKKDLPNTCYISSPNCSRVNLTSSNSYTYTGTWEFTLHPDVLVSLYADQSCTVLVQFTNDDLESKNTVDDFVVHSSLTRKTGLGTDGKYRLFSTIVKGARYCRVIVTTDSLATTVLVLHTEFGNYRQGNIPLNVPATLYQDAQFFRSTFTWLDTARGLFQGIESIKKFGRNSAVGTSFVPISLGGVYRTPQVGSETSLRIKAGGNANDTAAGTGARELTLIGLDENFAVATEAIATAGASASSGTTTTFLRNYRNFVSASGSYATSALGSHTANIVVENAAGGTDWAIIDATGFPKGQSEIGAFTIPANKIGFIQLRDISIDSGKTIDLVFFSREGADEIAAPYTAMRAQSVVTGVAGGSIETFGSIDVPFGPYTGPCDVGFMGKVASGSASVSVEFEIFLIDA